jgi:uncharacterized protein (TIGR00297 family)
VTSHSERARQLVHVGSAAFALLLRVLTWWQAAALAAIALACNLFVLPRIGGMRLYRPVDEARGFPLGIVLYPLSVLLLILLFPSRLDIVAAAWGILAFGDGFATLVGQRAATAKDRAAATASRDFFARFAAVVGRTLPWNREKTVAGTIAFMVCGGFGAAALALWTRPAVTPPPDVRFVMVAPLVAAVVAGLVETIPIRLDDNISVPMTAAAVLWLASLITPDAVEASRASVLAQLPWAIGVNAVVSYLGYRARTVSRSGTFAGAAIGIVIYAAGGWRAWLFLFLTFFAATAASKLGLKRKMLLGIEEERGGRRGAGNAFANCGIAAAAAIAAVTTPYRTEAWLAFVAALTAGGSDTVASEFGKAWGKSTFLVTTLGRVKPGTPGAMSLEGTTAGVVAAFALASAALALGHIHPAMILAVVVGATVGSLVESALGATLEGPGILNNDVLNFINTAVAAAVAIAVA